jgi:hypothetical protein
MLQEGIMSQDIELELAAIEAEVMPAAFKFASCV